MILVADLNVYCYSFPRILAPHTARGAVIREEPYFNDHVEAYEQTPRMSARKAAMWACSTAQFPWKDISRMKPYRGSQIWGEQGAFGLW